MALISHSVYSFGSVTCNTTHHSFAFLKLCLWNVILHMSMYPEPVCSLRDGLVNIFLPDWVSRENEKWSFVHTGRKCGWFGGGELPACHSHTPGGTAVIDISRLLSTLFLDEVSHGAQPCSEPSVWNTRGVGISPLSLSPGTGTEILSKPNLSW